MERTIKITGQGKISVKPDTIQLLMKLEGVRERYEQTLEQSALKTESLKAELEALGFEKSEIKTTDFRIDTEQENYQENNIWKHRVVGYKFTHSMKLSFAVDNTLLGKILYTLAHSEANPEFQIVYTTQDVTVAKNELLAKAVADSREKAMLLTQAGGVQLGEVVQIEYTWAEKEFSSRPIRSMAMACYTMAENTSHTYDLSIEAENIDVEDTVTVVWRIEK